ncbi:MAG: glycogen debranching enzyme N-terminal domain-containing protein [Thermodesulfobacteriota bacterium]
MKNYNLKGAPIFGGLTLEEAQRREWLVTNGLGSYASGTIAGLLTRRYHGLLIAALNSPVRRFLLVTKLDDTVMYDGQDFALFSNRWSDGTVDPKGYKNIESFRLEGSIPLWRYAIADAILEKRIWMKQGENTTFVRYSLKRASSPVSLKIKALVIQNLPWVNKSRKLEDECSTWKRWS